ncbi:hypothetical protein MHU86_1131 [Fragilaria crotonensis]|nr:hypothetical protein MHU86_1131 [Fragilaria crotonensis]
MSSSEHEKRERRWGRRGQAREDRSSDKQKEYVPPSLSDTSDFVTSPPKQRGLTTGISTLFRRAGAKEPSGGELEVAPAVGDTTLLESSLAGISMSRNNSRLFSNDDSDDSYESRVSAISRDDDEDDDPVVKAPIRRFRGFSTSLQSLFLDESLVCVSIGCFGLLLSQRTEFLLDVRNRQRGSSRRAGNKSVHRYPSRVISYALLVTILLMGGTFVVLGFGSSQTLQQYSEGDYYDVLEDDGQVYYENTDDDGRFVNDDANGGNANNQGDDANGGNANNQGDDANGNGRLLTSMRISGVFKIREYQENIWDPFLQLVHDEWHRDDYQRRLVSNAGDVGGTIRMVLALLFLVVLGVVGRRRRMRTRYALVRARAQEDHLHYASGTDAKVESTEGNYEGACSHTLCGCYPVDPPMQETHVEVNQFGKKRKYEDCVSRGFQCLMGCCCGVLCKCWFQCMSVCALAQEAREARLLVHPKFQRIDYITHQPFSEYQAAVNDLRRGWLGKTRRKAGFVPHIQALSRLSRYILITFSSVIVILSATLLFNPLASFSWPDLIVLMATFVQAFLVLYVVHWIFHKSDLSLDAVVKFFAAGFAIAVPTAFVLEGLLINVLLAVTYSLYGVIEGIRGEVFVAWVVKHYRFLWILGELINAYVVAAVTEELCKYYTFRSIEHPDLVFLTGLNRNEQASDAVVGGVISYPYGSHQVQQLNRNNSFDSVSSSRSTRSTKSATQMWIDSAATDEEFFEDENDVRTHRQKAAALTTGMISVAVGLACAENFLYVFFLGGTGSDGEGTIKEEWIVLFFRSIFPVHALAAAMQSIGMIRKFVECTSDANDHRIGVGRVILPAVVLHGSFDAVLLGINVYVESSWDTYLQANGGKVEEGVLPYNAAIVNIVAWLSIVSIMIGGILWYFREYRRQKMRLKILEQEVLATEGGSYSPTKGGPPTEVELV